LNNSCAFDKKEVHMKNFKSFPLFILTLLMVISKPLLTQGQHNPLILQEMTWPEVKEYLARTDMVIIPIGSTEQHGPHLPLGTDCFEAFEMAEQISSRTGVMVAPVIMIGYSPYHSGFPGTISIRSETLEQVLFESAEYLIKYGFRRIMFFNYHGGNNPTQAHLIERINQSTEAVAISIGEGSPIQNHATVDSFDYHAGVDETSIMLFLHPERVRKDKIQKPDMHFTPKMQELMNQSTENNLLTNVWNFLIGVPVETKKGGASNELSSNGIWTLKDPQMATAENGKALTNDMVDNAVKFIESWKKVKIN
jgi:creatinine amidohydrolase